MLSNYPLPWFHNYKLEHVCLVTGQWEMNTELCLPVSCGEQAGCEICISDLSSVTCELMSSISALNYRVYCIHSVQGSLNHPYFLVSVWWPNLDFYNQHEWVGEI